MTWRNPRTKHSCATGGKGQGEYARDKQNGKGVAEQRYVRALGAASGSLKRMVTGQMARKEGCLSP